MTVQFRPDMAPLRSPVLIITAGGLEHGGGIGRMIGYLTDEWHRDLAAPAFEVMDPRGPGPYWMWPRRFLATLWRIHRRARECPLAYIHVAGRASTWRKLLLTAYCRLRHMPVVLHLHDNDYERFCRTLPAPFLALVRWMFQTADHTIVLGEAAKRTITGLLGVPADRVSILANAVPAPAPAPAKAPAPVEILFLGQLSRRKGVHDLIEALDQPNMRDVQWHATIAGGGPHQETFEQQLAETAVADRVTMLGWVDRATTVSLLNRADILVLPSYAEGMAMSILEGLAHGLCVVCTPVGAHAEVIEHGRSGLLVEPGAVSQLSEALAQTVADGELRARLSVGAAERFRAGFDVATYPARLAPIMSMARHRRRDDRDRVELTAER
ncbi:MAG TPA: glycosyltransferase family 4 protein [Aliidongia sp.]|nr:glycosyltransferase family 4 protein [Aliidongia sp.]